MVHAGFIMTVFHFPAVKRFAFGFVLVLSASIVALANEPPAWLRQAASVTTPGFDKDVPAVVLYKEHQVSLISESSLVSTENYAVRLLNREGRDFAIARALYLVSSGKVREISGWVIRPDGTFKEYDKKSVLDIIADPDDVYNEYRLKIIDASNDVDAGFVFGYTVSTEETPLFYQDDWQFQDRLPTLMSRYSIGLPAGWKATSVTFNAPEVKPQVTGTTYSWEMRNLAPIPPEPMSPAVVNISPRVVINYAPDNSSAAANRFFTNWKDVSRWATTLYDPQVIVDDNVAAKARELTANAQTELDKIRAIGTFVQNLQYISIDIGVAYGNGFKPRPSSLVLSRGYGDCKDKANLMRAMLRALKIDAYPIAIYSGDPTYVREQWASPQQFNHCIIAIHVSDSTVAPTVIKHETLGRLLIFDATDPYTPVGDLPDYLQGSYALIIAGDSGGLAKMPLTPPETDLLERTISVDLKDTGEITGKISERANGQTSSMFRRESRELSAPEYKKVIESWLTRGATGAQLVGLSQKDRSAEGGFDLDVDFRAPMYGQLMQNRLLVFKPVIVGRRHGIYLTEPKRKNPIELESTAMKEAITFNLPIGFSVDEMPDAVNLDTAFGKYSTSYEVKANRLVFTRSLVMNRTLVPVENYNAVKDFFTKIREAEQAPVVLIRK
jgi:transglutaminase-like putative cysteine protease